MAYQDVNYITKEEFYKIYTGEEAMWKIVENIDDTSDDHEPPIYSGNHHDSFDKLLVHEFRILDDDRNPYYRGYSSCDSSFAPLDDYGTPNAGATDIQYKNKSGAWESL